MFSTTETILDATSRLLPDVGPPQVVGDGPTPNWNTAPTHTVAVLRVYGDALTLGPASWGYPAPWKKGAVLFNARGETVFGKPSFRGSAPCLFVMDGWYEWNRKRPHFVTGDGVLFVAGLCRPGEDGLDATIVTTASAGPVRWLHDRMPQVLGAAGSDVAGADRVRAWMDGDDDVLRGLAGSEPASGVLDALGTREVDRRVGNVANNGPDLIDAAG